MKAFCAISLLLSFGVCTSAFCEQPWPLGVRIMSYGKFQEGAMAHLQKIGVKHVFMQAPDADKVDETMATLKKHGLDTPVLRGQADLSKPGFAAELEPQLAVAEKMGAKYLFISAKQGESSLEDAYARLREAGDAAKKHGVIITLETHPDLGTNGDIQVKTTKAVNHPNVRVNFDTGNITYYNKGTTALAELKKSMPYVKTLEFKDHDGGFESWDFRPLGKGVVDFKAVVAFMKQSGYQGPVTIEWEGVKGVEFDEQQTQEAIAESVRFARSLGNFD